MAPNDQPMPDKPTPAGEASNPVPPDTVRALKMKIPEIPRAKLIADIRAFLKAANAKIAVTALHPVIVGDGFALESSAETLRKFTHNDRGFDNVDDLYRLYRFFVFTPRGRALRLPLVGPCTPIDRFAHGITEPQLDVPITMVGSYFVYHTAFLYSEAYTVRAMAISEPEPGLLWFDEYLGNIRKGLATGEPQRGATRATSNETDPTEYDHHGVVRFYRSTPQFTSITDKQTIGFRLMIGDWYEARDGIAPFITGRMIGMTTNGISYVRDVLIEHRSAKPVLDRSQSRIDTFENLTRHQQRMFEYLASKRTVDRIRDTGLDRLGRPPPAPRDEEGDDDL